MRSKLCCVVYVCALLVVACGDNDNSQICTAGIECGDTCVNPMTDQANCGSCGNVCEPGFVCNGTGICALSCQAGLAECDGTCVDTNTDRSNCGACGAACDAGEICNGSGTCELSCQVGLVNCNGTCIDPNSNEAYCGASGDCEGANAGETCGAGAVCNGAGVCELTCLPGFVECNGTCTDPDTSRAYCGATADCQGANAGTTCADGFICSTGSCQLSCQTGLISCNGTCIDPNTDRTYCGASGACDDDTTNGEVCGDGEVCNGSGTCQLSCQAGLVDCNGTCIDPLTDEAYCGAGADCTTDPGNVCAAGESCDTGACVLSCQSGLTNCSGVCTDTDLDRTNCGTCDNACASGFVCNGAGACALSCQSGLTDCNGVCTDTDTDRANCGMCGNPCADGYVCNGAGSCALSCQSGLTSCAGVCTDTSFDPNNCGDCGVACNVGEACVSGTCTSLGIDPDLVLYFNFEEASGGAIDRALTGNRTDGTFLGTVTRSSDGARGQYSLRSPSGSTAADRLDIDGDITDLDMTGPYSVMAWVKTSNASGGQGLIILGTCCTPRNGYTLNLQSDGTLRFWGGSDVNDDNYNALHAANIADGQWHHVGYRVNGTQIQFVVDGTPTTVTPISNIPTSPSLLDPATTYHGPGAPHIGGEGISGTTGADVLIDEVRVYRRYLSDADWAAAMSGN